MRSRLPACFLTMAVLAAVPAPAHALYRIDSYAGRGYGDGGPAIAASVILPADAVTDAAGNVYFSDRGNQLVRRVDAASGTITTVAGNGAAGSAGDGGPATLANLHDPDGLALDPAERYLYIVENLGVRVRRVDLTTGVITHVAGTGVDTGAIDGEGGNPEDDLGDGGLATVASFNQPVGVAVNAAGDVFVSERSEAWPTHDQHRPRIRRIDQATGRIETFAGGLVEGFNGDGHPALETQLADPIGLYFDAAGNLYFGELGNHRVRKLAVAPPHVITTVAGIGSFDEGPQGFSGDGGPATQAALDRPVRLSLWPRGCGAGVPCQFFIGDSRHHCVRWVDAAGIIRTVLSTPAGPTTPPPAGDSGDGGPAALARVGTPAALAGPGDTILVVDDSFNRIRIFETAADPLNATIRAFAGTGDGGFGGDGGPAVRALLNRPTGLTLDAAGNVYVAEHDNFRIRRIAADESHTISTFAGNGQRGAGGDGGLALDAQFDQPTGVTYTPAGEFLVSDARTQLVRRIDAGGAIARFAGQPYVAGFSGDNGAATAATLDTPLRTVVDPAGDVFIADFNNDRIRRVAAATGTITTFASGILNPAGLALAAGGSLYVSEFGRHRIVVVDAGGTVQPLAGSGIETGSIDGPGGDPTDDRGDDGPASAATFSDPTGLAFDVDGSLLVADQGNNVIRRIAPDGGGLSPASIVTTLAGDGRPTFGGDGGNALAASLNRPTETLVLPDGRIVIADRGNQRVRVLTSVTSLCEASCDDGDSCTVDACDPEHGCSHTATPDGDGDGVCDAADVCPDVPNPDQDPAACPGPVPGSCAAGDPSCIPGTGASPATECLVETVVPGAQGRPVVRCTDGDPACDADPAAGRCGFTLSWCFNNVDPRLACTASGLRRFALKAGMSPRSSARALVADALAAVGEVGAGTRARSGVVFAPPLTTANSCTRAVTVGVAVRGKGRVRPGRAVLVATGRASARGRDVDRVKLVCTPGG